MKFLFAVTDKNEVIVYNMITN